MKKSGSSKPGSAARQGNGFDATTRGESRSALSLQDAVRRGRWIALDLGASFFGVFFAGPSAKKSVLVPCFDSSYPGVANETRAISGVEQDGVVPHLRGSTIPFWWNDGPSCMSSNHFETLDWCMRKPPLATGTCGIGFPVQAERGQCGLVVFMGPQIALEPDDLYEMHARCFSLFDAVSTARPADGSKIPLISKRELECLKLTANGFTSEEIARLLKLSVHTANQYLTNTAQKLNAVNRTHAVSKAMRLGLIE